MSSRLQAEIKQTKPFATLEHEAILGLLRTAAIVDHASNELLRPVGAYRHAIQCVADSSWRWAAGTVRT